MTTYYERDGAIYTVKTMCNLVETWRHECRVYPNETRPCEETGCFDGRAMRNRYVCRKHAWVNT